MTMNLYQVTDSNYEWGCFVFDTTRNHAKHKVAAHFNEKYISLRCKTLKKGVNVEYPMIVDYYDSEGYDIVLNCGYRFATEEEIDRKF